MGNISKNRKHHYLYKTTNLVNGKFYYGMHSTDDLEDGYLGSGKYLWYAIKKYGAENFHIKILEFFETREALTEAEKRLITESQVKDSNCMNLKLGGSGGFTREQSDVSRVLANTARLKKLNEDPEYKKRVVRSISETHKKKYLNGEVPFNGVRYDWTGKKHKLETIEKIRQTREEKGLNKSESNSQFGTKWVTNEKENRKVKSTDLIPEGWRAGRKIKVQ